MKRVRVLYKALTGIVVVFLVLAGCSKDPDFAATDPIEEDIKFYVPVNWPAPVYNFENNTLSNAGFELGRKLFFETRLSRDNSVSCGTCHQPFAAFSHLDHPISHGIENKLGTRNSPPLFNLNWHPSFFWDGGVNHIESQPINPILNPVEMDETVANVIEKLKADAVYRSMFKKAFGDETINSQRTFKALAQFMGMLISENSRYDKYVRGVVGGEMNASELAGLAVFRSKCATCHKEPLFSDFSMRNNGLPVTTVNDSGRAHITRELADLYKFKVPSLRNLKYTYPYMHDGRFGSLEAVLDYYTTTAHNSGVVDPAIGSTGITLTTQNKTDLLNFLNTLNDEAFTKDKRFAEPK
jgi:cytochrome c peroxidase